LRVGQVFISGTHDKGECQTKAKLGDTSGSSNRQQVRPQGSPSRGLRYISELLHRRFGRVDHPIP
jgi:hypothetical protein